MNRSYEYIGHRPISYLGIMYRDLVNTAIETVDTAALDVETQPSGK